MYIAFLLLLREAVAAAAAASVRQLKMMMMMMMMMMMVTLIATCVAVVWRLVRRRGRRVYIVDYGCYRPPSMNRTPFSCFMEYSRLSGSFDAKSLDFQRKILSRSGVSQLTALPQSLHFLPPRISISHERQECHDVLFGAIDELLSRLHHHHHFHFHPSQIDVLVSNCSVFSPSPSITSMVVNRYGLAPHVKSFNLSGMGCSAGILALDLARSVLLANPRSCSYALVLSTENLTRSWYHGNDRSMLVTNCLFRVGGSAVLLSNRRSDRRRSKYEIVHTARSHIGADDNAYRCVFQEEDKQGVVGVGLSKDLMRCAAVALEHNMRLLGPKVLPLREIALYYANRLARSLSLLKQQQQQQQMLKKKNNNNKKGGGGGVVVQPAYVPKFRDAFDNVCIHAGGKAVIRAMEAALGLPFAMSEPSHMTLYRYGNISSSSVWYELSYEEAKGRIKKGNRVWQIGLGSGFKCNSAVLKALYTIPSSISTCWDDCIADMPVSLADLDQDDHDHDRHDHHA